MMRRALVATLVALVLVGGISALALADTAKPFYVHEVRTFMMDAPRRFARRVAVLHLGDEVKVVDQVKGQDWFEVRFHGKKGYVQLQALTQGHYGLRAGSARGASKTSHESVQLAARAFGPEVEQTYEKEHPDLDYHLVDAMEAVVPDPTTVVRFADKGAVKLGAK